MPTTITHTESGQVKYVQDDEVDSYLDLGVWEVDESATQDADGVNRNPDSGDVGEELENAGKPNVSDTKGDWVDYAKTQGYDEDEGLTKDELIERYG